MDLERCYKFDDGSFVKVAASQNSNNNNNRVKRSTSTGSFGASFVGKKIERQVGLQNAFFYADFWVARPGFCPSCIKRRFGANVSGFGANTRPEFEDVALTEELGQYPAAVRIYWQTKMQISASWGPFGGQIPVGGTCELWLTVGHGTYKIDTMYNGY